MPLGNNVYTFPELPSRTFRGLPGLLADSLPDKFGHALIDQWLARQGRTPDGINALDRLCYIGKRGMGALEFRPRIGPRPARSSQVDIDQLVELAADVLAHRGELTGSFLSPAFDVIYSYNPDGDWTRVHQMTINGKRDAFTLTDFEATARVARLKRGRWRTILDEVRDAVERWPDLAAAAGALPEQIDAIAKAHRLSFSTR